TDLTFGAVVVGATLPPCLFVMLIDGSSLRCCTAPASAGCWDWTGRDRCWPQPPHHHTSLDHASNLIALCLMRRCHADRSNVTRPNLHQRRVDRSVCAAP